MASVRYGLIVTDLVGKINGQNFQRGLQSPVLRNISTKRSFVKYPQISQFFNNPRAVLTMVSQTWHTLGSAVHSNWSAVAASFPRLNRYGVTYTPSAYQLFCEFNMYLVGIGSSIVTAAPTPSVFAATIYSASYAGGGGAITVYAAAPFQSTGYSTAIWASNYQSRGAGLQKSSVKMLLLNSFTALSPSYNIAPALYAVFGPAIPNTQIWIALQNYNQTTGETQVKTFASLYV
jgi:hypothetical protein